MDMPFLFTSALINKIESDQATVAVLRQNEKTLDSISLSSTELKYWGAIKALEKRIENQFNEKRFLKTEYVLEFKNSPYEVVSRRFGSRRHPNVVYDLCLFLDMPPLIVKRTLDMRATDWHQTKDAVKSPISPLEIASRGETYKSIDDATRRESFTTILYPEKAQLTQQLIQAYTKAW